MEKRTINPWKWQEAFSYVQAVEVTDVKGTLYVSGQTAIDAEGRSSNEDMPTQLSKSIANLEKVIKKAGYEPHNIVRLNVYTVSVEEFLEAFGLFQKWTAVHGIQQATTLIEVKSLYDTLKVELEATAVR